MSNYTYGIFPDRFPRTEKTITSLSLFSRCPLQEDGRLCLSSLSDAPRGIWKKLHDSPGSFYMS